MLQSIMYDLAVSIRGFLAGVVNWPDLYLSKRRIFEFAEKLHSITDAKALSNLMRQVCLSRKTF